MRPPPCAIMARADRLAHEEGALEVDGAGAVEVRLAHVLGGVLGRDTGVVDEDVDPAEARERVVHRAPGSGPRSVTSICSRSARRPMASISAAGVLGVVVDIAQPRATFGPPAWASASEIARPKPRAEPVTRAIWPVRSKAGNVVMDPDYLTPHPGVRARGVILIEGEVFR